MPFFFILLFFTSTGMVLSRLFLSYDSTVNPNQLSFKDNKSQIIPSSTLTHSLTKNSFNSPASSSTKSPAYYPKNSPKESSKHSLVADIKYSAYTRYNTGHCTDYDYCADITTEDQCRIIQESVSWGNGFSAGRWEPNAGDGEPAPNGCYYNICSKTIFWNRRESLQTGTFTRNKICHCRNESIKYSSYERYNKSSLKESSKHSLATDIKYIPRYNTGHCTDYDHCEDITTEDQCRIIQESVSWGKSFSVGRWYITDGEPAPNGCYYKICPDTIFWNRRESLQTGTFVRNKICQCRNESIKYSSSERYNKKSSKESSKRSLAADIKYSSYVRYNTGHCTDYEYCDDITTEDQCRTIQETVSWGNDFLSGRWEPDAGDGEPAPNGCYYKIRSDTIIWNMRKSLQTSTLVRHKICQCRNESIKYSSYERYNTGHCTYSPYCEDITTEDQCRIIQQLVPWGIRFLADTWDLYDDDGHRVPNGCHYKTSEDTIVWNRRKSLQTGTLERNKICKCRNQSWVLENVYICYHYTSAEKELMNFGGSSLEKEKEMCEYHNEFIYSNGTDSKAPGCGRCRCCQPYHSLMSTITPPYTCKEDRFGYVQDLKDHCTIIKDQDLCDFDVSNYLTHEDGPILASDFRFCPIACGTCNPRNDSNSNKNEGTPSNKKENTLSRTKMITIISLILVVTVLGICFYLKKRKKEEKKDSNTDKNDIQIVKNDLVPNISNVDPRQNVMAHQHTKCNIDANDIALIYIMIKQNQTVQEIAQKLGYEAQLIVRFIASQKEQKNNKLNIWLCDMHLQQYEAIFEKNGYGDVQKIEEYGDSKIDQMITTLGLETLTADIIRCRLQSSKLKKAGRNWTIDKILGKGNFGTTYLADNGIEKVALKKIKYEDKQSREVSMSEARIMMTLDSLYIVRISEVFTVKEHLYMVMQYCRNGTVEDLIKNKTVEEFGKIRIIIHIATALQHLHSQNICHRDIKPDNLLIDGDIVLLADFGLSRKIEDRYSYYTSQTGFLETKAPEVFTKGQWTTKADIWQVGLVSLSIYATMELKEISKEIIGTLTQKQIHILIDRILKPEDDKNGTINKLLNEMLSINKNKRCNANDILETLSAYSKTLEMWRSSSVRI